MYRMLTKAGWYPVSQKGSHIKMRHAVRKGIIIFPDHGANEMGRGLESKLLKQAGIKK